MSEPVCLTPDEADALRELIGGLAVIEERGFDNERQMCEISVQLWRDLMVRPAQQLRRVTTRRIESGNPQ